MAGIPDHISDEIADHLDAIKAFFKAPKLTLIVRAPELADGDLVMTDDRIADAVAALERMRPKEPSR